MQEKNHRRIELFAIAMLLVISIPSLDFLMKKAFADIIIQVVTPTGGTLSSTSDCTSSVRTGNVIWHNCNNTLYVLNGDTYVVITSLAVTMGASDRILGSPDSNSIFIITTSVNKYFYDGSNIVLAGIFSPTSCTLGDALEYDAQGFMWVVCSTQDVVIRFNPVTMTETHRSQDLTDGSGIECDSPTEIGYGPGDNIGAIRCASTANLITFSIANPTSINLLDSEATGGNLRVYIDTDNNKIIAPTGAVVTIYSYDGGGLMTLSQTISSFGADSCAPEYAQAPQKFIVCSDDSGTNTSINILFSNTTQVYFLANQIVSDYDASSEISVDVTTGTFVSWYVASSLNNQRIIIISGLREAQDFSPPPIGGTGDDDDNNQVNGVCGNTDTNGDGRVNVLDCVGGNSPFSGITGGRNVTEITALVTNGIGLTACEEDGSDQDTCGSGLFTFVMLLLITEFLVLAGYLGLTKITNSSSDIMDIALLLVIMAFVDLAIAFYLNWIPDIIFYTIVVIVAGFLAFGLLKKFRS